MEKMKFCILSVMLVFLISCSNDDTLKPGQGDDQQGLSGDLNARKVKGPVFTVDPSGDVTGNEDTDNLLAAFSQAKAAGPGATVQLVEGQYTIGMIEVRDFDGYFVGAGKGKTIISNAPDLPCEEAWEQDLVPSLILFVGGNITISDFTIHTNDGQPCAYGPINDAIYGDLAAALGLSDYSSVYMPPKRYIKAAVKNVDFIAGDDGGYGIFGSEGNVAMALFCGSDWMSGTGNDPLTNGEFLITGCNFENNLVGPDFWGFNESSVGIIENNIIDGGFQQIFIGSCLGSKVTIRNNAFLNNFGFGIYIDDADYGYYPNEILQKRSVYAIERNDFQVPTGMISIYLSDSRRTVYPDERYPQLFDIKFNTFNTQEGSTAILGLNNVDAKIWNNIFKGNGAMGVMLDGNAATETYAENCRIMGNNFSNADFADADVYLGEYTRNNMVVGVAVDNIADNGDDNKVIGVKANKNGPHYRSGMESNLGAINGKRMKPLK